MDYDKTKEMIHRLQRDGVHLTAISAELDYRDRANDLTWDDNLYEYTTDELGDIEELWCEIEPVNTDLDNASTKVGGGIACEIKCTRADCKFHYLDGCSYGGSAVQISELGCMTFEPVIDENNAEDENIHKSEISSADEAVRVPHEKEYLVLCAYDTVKNDGSSPQSIIIRVIATSPGDARSKVDKYEVENMFDDVCDDYIEDSLYSVRCFDAPSK